MRITSNNTTLPMHIARAYGVSPVAAVRPPTAAQKLVAGSVAEPVNFDATPARSTAAAPPAVFQLYTRAADRVEAAVGIQLGRTIDMKG